ncbi:MAG TPA: FAD-dependent tricarballylate dehydrogenase TcuA [Xanthobacteraceae bacterium]|jgi:tricarballylate dehydrogenase|nr:FAD-dependent tricarballylate dehydrogenase TcuA [Xanthobacteraceae bacterium]
MADLTRVYDVVVIGGGNAAMSAAITARFAGCSVLVLEAAPRGYRGGNSRHTRNARVMHEAPTSTLTEAYREDEYFDDLIRITGGNTDEKLARLTIRDSSELPGWMEKCGARFQPSLTGTLNLSRTNAFYLGGGKALVNAYYNTAETLGIDILYDTEVQSVELDGERVAQVKIVSKGFPAAVKAKTYVAAAGGFQANIDWLKKYWGAAADNFLIRGTPYAQGGVLKSLLDQNVQQTGDPTQFHCVAIDARAPKFDGGIVTRIDCIPFSIVVDRFGKRFYDEGEETWPKRYAIWGRLVAQQPDQIAYSIFDTKSERNFMPSVFSPYKAQTIGELAGLIGVDRDALETTVREYNAAVQPGTFESQKLDNCHTEGLTPPKSHWARTIDNPPFHSYPHRPGITFTYLGVKVDENARVQMASGKQSTNLFAAGEMMAGSILSKGYLAGFGMTIGAVFGRIAGREAAKLARN